MTNNIKGFSFKKKTKEMRKKEAGGRATIVLQLLRGDFFYCFLSENKLLPKLFFFFNGHFGPGRANKMNRLRKRSADGSLHLVDLLGLYERK